MKKCKNCIYHIQESRIKGICSYTYDISKLLLAFNDPDKECMWKEIVNN